MNWRDWASDHLESLARRNLRRELRTLDARGVTGSVDGRRFVSFASNDYLGLTQHPAVIGAARDALELWGGGAGSARLVVGSRPVHARLEEELARWKSTDRALLFSTGYMANLGVLAAFGGPDVLICSDELNHASIIDGCRLARAEVAVFPHCDMAALEILLRRGRRSIVVSDLVFSMDGDVAPIVDLTELCDRYGALLVVDEAHAVLGPELSTGLTEMLRVGTLSKTLGSLGGFVSGPSPLLDYLITAARPFIFTTAPAPANAAAALAALHIVQSPEGELLRSRLRANIDRVAPDHPSPIIPIVLGEERAALGASAELLRRGFLVPAIRPPSVPPGGARLRVTVSAAHTDEQLDEFCAALADVAGARAGV